MNIDEGASHEILSRWPEHKQRNVALMPLCYGEQFARNLIMGIELVRSHHNELKAAGVNEWSISSELSQLLDDLASGVI